MRFVLIALVVPVVALTVVLELAVAWAYAPWLALLAVAAGIATGVTYWVAYPHMTRRTRSARR
jgi:ABC-type bacteriocin/lantibiotic exporter with double-glycine peptidase domain